MTVKAVIFDLDDTLYDEKQFVKSGFKAVSSYMAEEYGVNRETFYRLLLSIFSKQGREKVFDSALKKLNMYKKDVVLEMVKVYRNHHPNITLFKEAQMLLPEMRKKYRLGLITDGIKKVQENKVEALRIKDLFDAITYAVEHGGKKAVQPFLVILEKLKVKPSESIYIDDNPQIGFAAAKKTGILTVRILRGENEDVGLVDEKCKPEFEIKNLRQLFKVIRTIESEKVSRQKMLESE